MYVKVGTKLTLQEFISFSQDIDVKLMEISDTLVKPICSYIADVIQILSALPLNSIIPVKFASPFMRHSLHKPLLPAQLTDMCTKSIQVGHS